MKRQRWQWIRLTLVTLCVLALSGGAVLWILNLEAVITGPWSSILGALFTALSAVFALLQWQLQPQLKEAPPPPDPLVLSPQQQGLHAHLTWVTVESNKRKGALIVKTNKKQRGITIHLCPGFDSPLETTEMAANVVERSMNGMAFFVALFHMVEPGNYTVYSQNQTQRALVTIHAGQIAEIDWRTPVLTNQVLRT